MIWYECDACQKAIPKHQGFVVCDVKPYGMSAAPVDHTVHLCEECYSKIRKTVEVAIHDA